MTSLAIARLSPLSSYVCYTIVNRLTCKILSSPTFLIYANYSSVPLYSFVFSHIMIQTMKTFYTLLTTLLLSVTLAFGASTQAEAASTHTVSSGDTMWKIAVRYQVGVTEIIDANPQLSNPNLIYPGQTLQIPGQNTNSRSMEQQVVSLVNAERAKHGLNPLKENWELSRVARFKSEDMSAKNYFSHTSPTYGSPHQMIRDFGITYRASGENIAAGQTSAQSVFNSWMNSSGHRQNILSPNYTEIGVGYADGGSYGHYWTQMFVSK